MFLAQRPRPWKIVRRKGGNYFDIYDANGKHLTNFYWYDDAVSNLGYVTRKEAEEMAVAFARLSRDRSTPGL